MFIFAEAVCPSKYYVLSASMSRLISQSVAWNVYRLLRKPDWSTPEPAGESTSLFLRKTEESWVSQFLNSSEPIIV